MPFLLLCEIKRKQSEAGEAGVVSQSAARLGDLIYALRLSLLCPEK